MNIRDAYAASLRRHGHSEDAAQLEIIAELEALQARLSASRRVGRGLRALLASAFDRPIAAPRGLYIWGDVGRGKTFLMDLFFENLPIRAKRRVHFHRMMHEVHQRLTALPNTEDPLDKVAADVARETRVLCFDEFFVSDIGDAMILGRLLEGLFRRGVCLVATSNTEPDELYKDGLQRQRFLQAITLLKTHTRVVSMSGATDYRLRLLQKAGTYIHPNDARAGEKLAFFFDESASSEIRTDKELDVYGRKIRALKCAKGIAWFSFDDICDGPRSQADYIEIARWYPTVIVSGVPCFTAALENQARRFIALVDEFYDRRVKLILSAETGVRSLYQGSRLTGEFDRTISRLIEMQSTEYLALPHLA